jgi:hypothetical protein
MGMETSNSPELLPPGYMCPFCGKDCAPIAAGPVCAHFFLADGENGWRHTEQSRRLFGMALGETGDPTLFRELLYHDPACRAHLRLRRADYQDSVEMYVYSEDPAGTVRAFEQAIAAASAGNATGTRL